MQQKTEGGPDRVAVLQILAVEQRLLAVRGLPDAVDEQRGLFSISAQPLVIWGGPSDADALQGHLEVFVVQEPQDVDVLLVAGTSLECRAGMLKWRAVFASRDPPAPASRDCARSSCRPFMHQRRPICALGRHCCIVASSDLRRSAAGG